MRKARSLIAAFLVVLIQITPGPLGLRPAQAALPLAVVAVGAMIAATGVMVAGAGVYKPPTFAQANAAVDQVTGDITRKVVVARSFAEGLSSGLRGFQSQYTLDYDKVVDWVKAHPVDYPLLSPAVAASETVQPYTYSTGNVFSTTTDPYLSRRFQTLDFMGVSSPNSGDYPALYYIPGGWWWNGTTTFYSDRTLALIQGGISYYTYKVWFGTTETTTEPLTPLPVVRNPPAFSAAYPNTEAGQDETDRVAAENPSAVKAPPSGITPEQAKEAAKQAEAAQMQAAATTAEAAAAADPTNTALQIAAAQARSAADQATIQAQGQTVELETTPAEETEADIPYNPSALSGPYTLPAVDFGARFQTFIDAIKATSFFSLPGSIASGIPASSSSVITINGGETIGTHDFDFADMDNLWAILRSVVLTGFMFVSIRIVCLHR